MSGRPGKSRFTHSQRFEDGLGQIVRECDSGLGGDQVGENLESGARVDALAARFGLDLLLPERETGGMGEQVTNRRPGRTRGLIEVERAFLDGDEHRVRDERLGDRRQRIHLGCVTDGAGHAAVARQNRGGGMVDGPLGDQIQTAHRSRLEDRRESARHQSASVYRITPRMFFPSSMSW